MASALLYVHTTSVVWTFGSLVTVDRPSRLNERRVLKEIHSERNCGGAIGFYLPGDEAGDIPLFAPQLDYRGGTSVKATRAAS